MGTKSQRETGRDGRGDADESTGTGRGTGGEASEQAEPTPRDIFDVLQNERRQLVLQYLREESSTADLGDLAEYVAAAETGKDEQQVRSEERKRLYVGLYQSHLPKMHEAGVVHFDRDRGRIELTAAADRVYDYLDVAEGGTEQRWYRYYGAVAVAGGVATAAVWTGLVPNPLAVLTALVLALGCCTMAHLALASRWDRSAAFERFR